MIKIKKLSNGITVVYDEMANIRSVAVGVWVRTGSRHEKKSQSGLSHFIEHMLFKGTEKRTAKMIADEMDAVGGQMNAYTTKEYTCYYARVLDTHIDTALDVLSDMLLNPVFDDGETAKERNVITEEINMYEDSPEDMAHDFIQASVFKGASLGRPVIGYKEVIDSVNGGVLRDYYKKRYTPENIVISVAGSFNEQELLEKIERFFGGLSHIHKAAKPAEAPVYKPVRAAKAKDAEQVHLCIGFPGKPFDLVNIFPLHAMNAILGGTMSSRLFQAVREERGLSYAIYSHFSCYSDCGLFYVYTALIQQQVEEVTEIITNELKRFFTDRVTAEQLAKTKEQIKSNLIMGLENTQTRMSTMGNRMLLLNTAIETDEIISKIDALTVDDIYRLADETLDMKNMSVCAVGDINGLKRKGFFKNVK